MKIKSLVPACASILAAVVFCLSGSAMGQSKTKAQSMIEKKPFGQLPDGSETYLYTLENANGMIVRISDYGATVVSILVPDRNGRIADVALGYDSVNGYMNGTAYFGGVVGRYANRIANGKFTIDGKSYQVTVNDGRNTLHGGKIGFNKVLWKCEEFQSPDGPSLKLTYVSKDGEEGFPGTVTVTTTYTLMIDNSLRIEYTGTTDKPTVLNVCNHSYFNLSGDPNKTILDEELVIDADKYTPVDSGLIPTGALAPVEGTPMDFRKMTVIGARIGSDNEQLKVCRGYDMNWVLNNYDKKVRKVAELLDPSTGRDIELYTDQPGLQFYTGNFLNGTEVGKNGVHYQYRTGLALETQFFPDTPNEPAFPSAVLRPGQTYTQTTIYKFSVKE